MPNDIGYPQNELSFCSAKTKTFKLSLSPIHGQPVHYWGDVFVQHQWV
jgi:hypothetical protein